MRRFWMLTAAAILTLAGLSVPATAGFVGSDEGDSTPRIGAAPADDSHEWD